MDRLSKVCLTVLQVAFTGFAVFAMILIISAIVKGLLTGAI